MQRAIRALVRKIWIQHLGSDCVIALGGMRLLKMDTFSKLHRSIEKI